MKILLCADYHVTAVTLDGGTCQHRVTVRGNRNPAAIGYAPCNRPTVVVEDAGGTLFATFLIGGRDAVEALVLERCREVAEDVTGHGGPPRL